jgi:carbamoyl-phosphate synthase large subunit
MQILVTAIGSMSARTVCKKLQALDCFVIGTDIYPKEWQTNLKYVHKFKQVPKFNQNNFISELLNICKKNKVEYVFPLTDPEVDILSRNIELFELNKITLCISCQDTISKIRDKSKIKSNIPDFSIEELSNKSVYPIIAKPKKGRSSEGKFFIEREEQLSVIQNKRDYIFQKFIDGKIIAVDVVRDKNGNTVCVARKEHTRTSNGAGIVVEIFKDIKLENIAYEIAAEFNVLGCVNIEFIYSDNKYYLMDINPRFSAGIGFSCAAGYNFVKNHLVCFQGKHIMPLKKINLGIQYRRSEP